MSGRLQNKVALVVGAGSIAEGLGNGKAAAIVFAREGARVFAVDLNLDAVKETVAIIESEGVIAVAYGADATDADAVNTMVTACVERFGRIDILHNNVGGSIPGGPVDITEEDWDANIAYNIKPAFLACKYVIPRYVSRPLASYQTSKAGLQQFSRAVGVQYAKAGIRSNTVVPGMMNTPLVQHRLVDKGDPAKAQAVIAARDAMSPTGKMGDAWDVAYAALFLASDEAKYVNATELIVDGGLTAQCG